MKTLLCAVTAVLFAVNVAASPDSASLIRGNTTFAVELYRLQAGSSRGNVFFSPYSISAAMALTDAGARGTTASEIEKALHFPFTGARLTAAWKAVQDDIGRKRPDVTLMTANALWAAKGVELHPEYLAFARRDFGAKLETVDFARPEPARQRINAWISEATRQKIPELIGSGMLAPSTRLVLTNAIYMKAKWLSEFPPRGTNPNGRFHTPAGERKAAMMSTQDDFNYARSGSVRILELPYLGSELSMLVVLPDAADGLSKLEKELTVEQLAQWEAELKPALVAVTFPRFKTDLSIQLSQSLRAMGIHEAFSAKADFSGIAKEPLLISDVIHQARIDVAEEGTEAAAATAVIMRATAAPPMKQPKPEIFNADHPFLYLIRRTDTKSVLFIGRLVQP
ncbi:MAG TPA: serpin family protein [Thermoanaerobaculia bacterium]|nr:serpin family protein [Thermoanaerobaculia bacterium]